LVRARRIFQSNLTSRTASARRPWQTDTGQQLGEQRRWAKMQFQGTFKLQAAVVHGLTRLSSEQRLRTNQSLEVVSVLTIPNCGKRVWWSKWCGRSHLLETEKSVERMY
jgi:hypothetical protein